MKKAYLLSFLSLGVSLLYSMDQVVKEVRNLQEVPFTRTIVGTREKFVINEEQTRILLSRMQAKKANFQNRFSDNPEQAVQALGISIKPMQQVLEQLDVAALGAVHKRLELEFVVALADQPWDASVSVQEYVALVEEHLLKIDVVPIAEPIEQLESPDTNIRHYASAAQRLYFGGYYPSISERFNKLCARLSMQLLPDDLGDKDYADFILSKNSEEISRITQDLFAMSRTYRYVQAAAATRDMKEKSRQLEFAESTLLFAEWRVEEDAKFARKQ